MFKNKECLFTDLLAPMPAKKYRVELTEEQRSHLFERIGRGERPARELTRARILLKVDEGGGSGLDRPPHR